MNELSFCFDFCFFIQRFTFPTPSGQLQDDEFDCVLLKSSNHPKVCYNLKTHEHVVSCFC